MAEPPIDKVIARYMQFRQERDDIERVAKEKIKTIDASMDKLEAFILAKMEAEGVTTFKTPFGTAFKSTSDFASVSSWDDTLEFIKDQEAWHLLERRVNKIAVREYVDSGSVPPGVTYGTKVNVSIRRPTNK